MTFQLLAQLDPTTLPTVAPIPTVVPLPAAPVPDALYGGTTDAVVCLLVAALAGLLLGLGQVGSGRRGAVWAPISVCVASALVVLVGLSLATTGGAENPVVGGHFAMLGASAVVAAGLLAAGQLAHARGHGSKAAASLLSAAALGLAAGRGLYLLTLIAAAGLCAVLLLSTRADAMFRRSPGARLRVRRAWDQGSVEETVRAFASAGYAPRDVSFKRIDRGNMVLISMRVTYRSRKAFYDFAVEAEKQGIQVISSQEV